MQINQRKLLLSSKGIDALYEVDTACGSFAAVIKRSDGTEELYPNCKVDMVLDKLAAERGKSLARLRLLRGRKLKKKNLHVDFYEIGLPLILMPVRHRRAVNSNHGVMAFLNVARICKVEGKEQAVVTFISGEKLQLRESAYSVRAKLVAGRELLYENMFARSEELHYMRVTLRRLHRFMGEDL